MGVTVTAGNIRKPLPAAHFKEGSVQDGNASGLNGLKILVIDDSKTIRRTAETPAVKRGM